jgi:hypothetical protein
LRVIGQFGSTICAALPMGALIVRTLFMFSITTPIVDFVGNLTVAANTTK